MRHHPNCSTQAAHGGECDCGGYPESLDFRLVAKGGKWEVHTAVPPTEGLEVRFTSGLTV